VFTLLSRSKFAKKKSKTFSLTCFNLTRSADSPLTEALSLMNNEGLTSVAVVDNGLNVVGTISTADVKHLTNAASLPMLQLSCMHFISVILSERGVERGRDSFPVFYVNPYSTLAHTVAKLVATQSHRMWVVESASPSPSTPATPLLVPAQVAMAGPTSSAILGSSPSSSSVGIPGIMVPGASTATATAPGTTSTPQSPLPGQTFAAVPASALPGAHLSGRLTGVVSLTDILNLFAKSSGLNPSDPAEQRARRRRSSSSSVRPSMESGRLSSDFRR
jgi:CBS domain-containing protein